MKLAFSDSHRPAGTVSAVPLLGAAFLGACLLLCTSHPARAAEEKPLRVVTTLAVLESLVKEVGGDRVQVESLADAGQDPHFVQPRPTLMKKAYEADVFVEVGLQLELWADKVAAGSGNPRIQMGQPGRIVASTGIATLELPTVLSRDQGDIHPYGNPHVWLDPCRTSQMAANIATGLQKLDPGSASTYQQNLTSFQDRLARALYGDKLVQDIGASKLDRLALTGLLSEYLSRKGLEGDLGGWCKKGISLRGIQVITYHKSWSYLADRFGFTIPIEIEEKPGISPSAKHRDHVIQLMKEQKIGLIALATFYPLDAARFISEETGARIVQLPLDVEDASGQGDYFHFMDTVLDRLVGSVEGASG